MNADINHTHLEIIVHDRTNNTQKGAFYRSVPFYLNHKGPQSKNAAIDFRCYRVFAHLVSGDVRPV